MTDRKLACAAIGLRGVLFHNKGAGNRETMSLREVKQRTMMTDNGPSQTHYQRRWSSWTLDRWAT